MPGAAGYIVRDMRIGIYTEVYKPVVNGVVVSVESFRVQLEALGHEVYVFTPSPLATSAPPTVEPHVLPYLSLPLPTEMPYRFTTPFRLHGRQPELDLIHAQSPFNTGLLAWSHARREGIPLVFTYHTRLVDYSHYLPTPEAVSRRYLRWVSRTYSNLADRVIVPTEPIKDLLEGYGVHRPIDVVPTPVRLPSSPTPAEQSLRERAGVPAGRRVLLTVGRLALEKNFRMLLDCFAAVCAEADLHLVVVGDGPLRESLEAHAADAGLAERVTFAGQVEHERIHEYYAAADLFVFASLTETQGLVLDEALQMGVPVLAVAEGGAMDVLASRPGALTVPPTDRSEGMEREFVAALRDLTTREGALDHLRAQAVEHASADAHVDSAQRLLAVYQAAVANFEPRGVRVPSFMTRLDSRIGRRG